MKASQLPIAAGLGQWILQQLTSTAILSVPVLKLQAPEQYKPHIEAAIRLLIRAGRVVVEGHGDARLVALSCVQLQQLALDDRVSDALISAALSLDKISKALGRIPGVVGVAEWQLDRGACTCASCGGMVDKGSGHCFDCGVVADG